MQMRRAGSLLKSAADSVCSEIQPGGRMPCTTADNCRAATRLALRQH